MIFEPIKDFDSNSFSIAISLLPSKIQNGSISSHKCIQNSYYGQNALDDEKPTMTFSTTPLYALPVALIYLLLWLRVTALRSSTGISIGDGGNIALLQRIRQHGNCAEWSGFILILMILAEGMTAPAIYLHVSGTLLLIGRIAHPFGLKPDNAGHLLRYVGNGTNILAALNTMICLVVNILGL